MVLSPVIPILVLLYWLFRYLHNRRIPPEERVPAPRATQLRISVGHVLLFLVFYLPWAVVAAVVVGERGESAWLGLLGFVAAAFVICMGPRWLAWRVLGPLGLLALGRVVLWLAPSFALATFRGNLELFSAAYGGEARPKRWKAGPWFLFARAVRSERDGDPSRAETLLELLCELSLWRLPWRLRGQGFELLAWPAIRSGDWPAALRRLERGRGRGVRLLRLLAAAHLGTAVTSHRLWLAWLLAPVRRQTRPLLLAVLDSSRFPAALMPGLEAAAEPSPEAEKQGVWRRHLELLAAAAEGRELRPADVEEVAEGWEGVLNKSGQMQLLARGAELDVPDVQSVVAALRPALRAELEAVAEIIEGPWPEPRHGRGLAAEVRRRRMDRLFAAVQVEVEPFLGQNGLHRALADPLQELERWLQFRRDVRRLLEASGEQVLPTAWYNGVRYAACNWPVFLLRTYGLDAHWACRQMFRWSETLARRVGDEEIAKLSRRNLREVRTFLT